MKSKKFKMTTEDFWDMIDLWKEHPIKNAICPWELFIFEKYKTKIDFNFKSRYCCRECAVLFGHMEIYNKHLDNDLTTNLEGPCPCDLYTLPKMLNRLDELKNDCELQIIYTKKHPYKVHIYK
jgi:hypothetical protein